jgi:SAM-dependent methyltransferase
MSHLPEHLAQAISAKARKTEIDYRHDLDAEESSVTKIMRKTLARLLRPLTSLIKETAELHQGTVESLVSLQKEFESFIGARNLAEEHSRKVQNVLADNSSRLDALERENADLRKVLTEKSGTSGDLESSADDVSWDEFYKRFEDKFRGDPHLLMERLSSRYRSRLEGVFANQSKGPLEASIPVIMDLGCGRGEFLNLAKEIGYKTIGVDFGSAMVREAQLRGHEVYRSDILSFLKTSPDAAYDVISMFHVIEHCKASYSFQVFAEAARTLKPGGVFLVETPSIFSLWVTARQFYLDPTHTQPVHPEYMSFMAFDAGFSRSEIIEFDAVEHTDAADLAANSSGPLTKEFRKLEKWLYGPQDISIWAVK